MDIARWTRKPRRFWALSLTDKWLVLRAVFELAVARVWLITASFPDLAQRLSADPGTEEADADLLRRVGFAVATAGANVPWRSDCFPQAIAANRLLRKHGYASIIHLGVDKVGNDQLLAHAWLTSGVTIVTGEKEAHRYAEIHRLGE